MNDRIVAHLKSAKAGDPQVYRNIVIFPMTGTIEGDLDYLTLGEALESRLLTVTEVTAGGSVPELKVTNSADKPVLLLDGEELAGAKQNRVLNTTVLVPAKQSVVIPVSCTEQGEVGLFHRRVLRLRAPHGAQHPGAQEPVGVRVIDDRRLVPVQPGRGLGRDCGTAERSQIAITHQRHARRIRGAQRFPG